MAAFCPTDPNSYANTHEVALSHTHLSWAVNFDTKTIDAIAVHTLIAQKDDVKKIVLDTNHLTVDKVFLVGDGSDTELSSDLAPRDEKFGAAFTIHLKKPLSAKETVKVSLKYTITEKSAALQWLTPSQTVGKQHPYLFSQCQAIHARSIVPIQDTPGNKITYSADVTVPSQLRALMSAVRTGEDVVGDRKKFSFSQKVSIPSYLIALAVGNIEGKQVGHRSTVWSEPEVLEAAAWEFAGTEEFIKTGEDLLSPYDWGIYDLLLLPASFPYGGMENPCLTFVTPTLLAGDRSLVDVVAHEISHSWMGNLVTTQNWEHFWLNEGFTVFVERKITGRLHGRQTAEFQAIIGVKALQESLDHLEESGHPEYTCLCPRLKGQDPDDVFSSVPYEKGFSLLYYLEKTLGGPEVFEPYLKAHVRKFAHKSINTTDFKNYLYEFFADKKSILDTVDWDAWFFKPGKPPVLNQYDDTLAKACEELAQEWDKKRGDSNPTVDRASFDKFNAGQKIMFLEKLLAKDPFPHPVLAAMQKTYDLNDVGNAEIKCRWLWLCLNASYEEAFPFATVFLGQVGRMKFVRVLYRALNKAGPKGAALAKETFLKNRNFYHPICAGMVAKDLGIQ
ncbi:peptidase family M1-domain-containing protein [Fimicolochytrium jonesii]|uniref:peptidase family M1-domain-containing protein n=1 Tax=Fimicolochytrium jonesii TaxID=1396493 RepID=UPI0022FDE949|nr:peptidase family M1-domain-containing protein [Fimicolochytrium jonesii]KAI8823567.1 peptidase family M1-domain-containing protein [Fimicolochytrium jonesii]